MFNPVRNEITLFVKKSQESQTFPLKNHVYPSRTLNKMNCFRLKFLKQKGGGTKLMGKKKHQRWTNRESGRGVNTYQLRLIILCQSHTVGGAKKPRVESSVAGCGGGVSDDHRSVPSRSVSSSLPRSHPTHLECIVSPESRMLSRSR